MDITPEDFLDEITFELKLADLPEAELVKLVEAIEMYGDSRADEARVAE
jgi:hypothetical protein